MHPVKEQLLRLQKQIGQIYETVLEEPEDGILKAMVLGDKTELDSEVQKLYQQNGISHVLAISGLHISLIGMGLYKMLKRITGYGLISGNPNDGFAHGVWLDDRWFFILGACCRHVRHCDPGRFGGKDL